MLRQAALVLALAVSVAATPVEARTRHGSAAERIFSKALGLDALAIRDAVVVTTDQRGHEIYGIRDDQGVIVAVLELDMNGKVVGGTYLDESEGHPDFLWAPIALGQGAAPSRAFSTARIRALVEALDRAGGDESFVEPCPECVNEVGPR